MSNLELINKYLKQVHNLHQDVILASYKLITKWHPTLDQQIWQSMGSNIFGWGYTSYQLASGQVNDWFVIGLAPRKHYCSLYIWGWQDDQSLLEQYQARLGSVKVGKSCLNFKTLSDINLDELKSVTNLAVKFAHQVNNL